MPSSSRFSTNTCRPRPRRWSGPGRQSDIPEWARRWQRLLFDNGWLLPGNPPEFGGRNATLLQQYVHREELSRRRIYHSFNPQGVGIIAASLLSFGTPEQKQRWAVPILRAEITASLGMSEPGAGSDLASLRTRAVRDGDHFVVNGQKVWTSGAHDADVLLTFVRTDPDAPKHKGISVLLIPTDLPGVVRRPFASACDHDDLDFNEVFFTDVRVPAENLVGQLNDGWRVANGSLGHERTMLWLSYADRLQELRRGFPAAVCAGPRPVRHARHGQPGAAAARLGGVGPRRAGRRGRGRACRCSSCSARRPSQTASEHALSAAGVDGLAHPSVTGPYSAHEPRSLQRQLVRALRPFSSAARSPAARRKSSATSSPSECWACPEIEEQPCISTMTSPTRSRPSRSIGPRPPTPRTASCSTSSTPRGPGPRRTTMLR